MNEIKKPVILITGAAGNIGGSLCTALKEKYHIIGLDRYLGKKAHVSFKCDLTSDDSIKLAFHKIKEKFGSNIAAVIHLAAYFDFTGKPSPLYDEITVKGTKRLLKALQDFNVERFMYASTMLVHEATIPGHRINEESPLKPGWAYPKSKEMAEKIIRENHGSIPFSIFRLAGLYDTNKVVPTLAYQIARIYDRDLKSHLYAGDLMAGQAFIHQEDMVNLFAKALERRNDLPEENTILAGERDVMGYQQLQNRIGGLIFGEKEWKTIDIPEYIAKPGAWLQEKAEPVIPDAIDQGQKPFIKTFMIDLASDHYELDTQRAKNLLDWTPQHNIYDELETLILNLKKDPVAWYEHNGIMPPDWVKTAEQKNKKPDNVRTDHETAFRRAHRDNLWAHFLNMGLAFWLITGPYIIGYQSDALILSDMISGIALFIFAFISLSYHFSLARWICGAIGFWLLCAPLIFWAPTSGAYLNDTLIGMLVMGFSVLTRPVPGVSSVAAETGPTMPPGWRYSPSGWFQRLPIIILAFIGFFISRYLCAYQLGHIDGIWDPFFTGIAKDPQNGTEEIITSSLSKAWPVPDAGLGALTYALEIVTGLMGSSRRWRTMPWLVIVFGIMIVPLGAVSIFFIIVQPILIGTWCTLCLIGAAAMLIQIPYSLDELVATGDFLYRRKVQGRPLLRIFFTGDTDDGSQEKVEDDFEQSPTRVLKEMLGGGVNLPWNLVLCIPLGLWLMFTRLTLGTETEMANADHLIGALVLTVIVTALAEVGRAARFLLIPLGLALLITPFAYETSLLSVLSSLLCGLILIILSLPRGKIYNDYGLWNKFIV